MLNNRKSSGPNREAEFLARVRSEQSQRQAGYRDQALALFPHVCARCGREFSGKNLRELTVHHKDNDHMNNPRDGSNWELLCLYCHDDAHGAYERTGPTGASTVYSDEDTATGFNAFAGLKDLLKPKTDDPDSAQE